MREIKFRAWDSDREEMLYEGWTGKPQFFVNMGVWQFTPEPTKLHMMDKKLNFHAMQYTGLKDKNGVEIYEGDIVREGKFNRYKIVWVESMAGFKKRPISRFGKEPDELMNKSDTLEVIGNIMENPELLTKEPTDE